MDMGRHFSVYELIGSRWIDQGTAFCFGQFSEETNEALLIARSERNYNDIILSTAIRSNDVYQRQQDTLIVWTEPDGVDYALSFQDPDGCAEVWNFILEVQRHMNATGPETSVTTASIIRSGHLPPPQLGIISEIERAIKSLARTQVVKERICEYIQQEDYIKSLIKVMGDAEDLESLENLHALCSLMQTILLLNDHSMYEHILEDEIFFGVVGMLEYDPDFPGHKANYRDFLHNTAQFHQPIPMRDIAIQRKIHHTYRLQFLKDVVLARALDDSTFNVLNSCIIFNQIDIITHIQQDPSFLRDVVRLFVDEDMLTGGGPNGRRLQFQQQQVQPQPHNQPPTSPQHMIISLNGNGDNVSKPEAAPMDVDQKTATSSPGPANGTLPVVNGRGARRSNSYAFAPPDDLTEAEITLRQDVILLLQQLCIMGKNVQMPARMALFRTLVDRGILFAVQWALNLPEKEEINRQMISAAGEILTALLDHDLNGVRGHVLKQVVAIEKEREAGKKGADKAETVLAMACRIMAQSKDLAVQSQIGDALKVWMDVPSVESPPMANAGSEYIEAEADETILWKAVGPKLPVVGRKDDPGTERYMEYFYKDCAQTLLKPLIDLPEWRNFHEPILPLTREETNRFVYLCDLLHNFIQQHQFRSHFHVMSSNILSSVATLFKGKDKFLRHSAFRIFRLLLKQGNPNSHAQIMKQDILKPILDLTIKESLRDNLLSCSCQEYFEHMRKENLKEMIRFCMTRHEPEIQKLAKSPIGSQRFELFIRRWEMNNAPPPEESTPDKSVEDRGWSGPGRLLDLTEEDYFNADDEEDEVIPSISQQQSWFKMSPLAANNTGMKRKRRPGISGTLKGYRPPLRAPQLGALVDYDEDDEDSNTNPHPSDLAAATPQASGSTSAPPETKPSSPKPSHRSPSPSAPAPTAVSASRPSGPPPKRATKHEDEEDNLLEALARSTRARSPSPHLGPMRPSEKRRRVEDEDDELLARLSKSSKKPDLGSQKEAPAPLVGRSKNGDDPPGKKIKVKLGAVGLAVASTPPAQPTTSTTSNDSSSSEPSTKDGDTG
ncbi:component of IIS longevity pathway SMK-1-domain-containing protein [Flammula alnicola]|nr:component of IIS longevity pathway SMK-1-domain-containing protein [Flammula alnicola]